MSLTGLQYQIKSNQSTFVKCHKSRANRRRVQYSQCSKSVYATVQVAPLRCCAGMLLQLQQNEVTEHSPERKLVMCHSSHCFKIMYTMELSKNVAVSSKSLFDYSWKITILPFPRFIGEVGTFILFWCQVSLGCIPKIIKICWFFTELFKNKKADWAGTFLRHIVFTVCYNL